MAAVSCSPKQAVNTDINKLCGRQPQYASAPCDLDLWPWKWCLESCVTWATSVPILVFLGLYVLDLGPMYATDRRQTVLSLNSPCLGGGGIINGSMTIQKICLWCFWHCQLSDRKGTWPVKQESVRPRWPYDMRPSVRAEKYIRDASGWRKNVTDGNDNGTDGQTDRQTDRQSATQYAAPPREEGRIKTKYLCMILVKWLELCMF